MGRRDVGGVRQRGHVLTAVVAQGEPEKHLVLVERVARLALQPCIQDTRKQQRDAEEWH